MERFAFIFLVAGLGFFALAFGVSAYLPTLGVQELKVVTVEELASKPFAAFLDLKDDYPQAFRKAFYSKTDEQALTQLQQKAPETFRKVFEKSDDQILRELQSLHPELWTKVFGKMTLADAKGDFDFSRDDYVAKIKATDPGVYSQLFESSIPGAMTALKVDYGLTLLKVKTASPAVYHDVFDERPDSEVLAQALRRGLQIYQGEGCWHCHSQQVPPWGGDEARYGQMSYPEEYHNQLNIPPLWGTRRVGPDLIRRGGKLSNDWHVAHFYNPRDTSPVSVMPQYTWFFESDHLTPNRDGLCIITYVQWLGSWQDSRDETVFNEADIDAASKGVPEAPKSAMPDAEIHP